MRIDLPGTVRERTPFIGRLRERKRLLEDLKSSAGLITITGPSGIGKTRLARQVASELAGSFQAQGGAWFCNLGAARTVADVEEIIARAIGAPRQEGEAIVRALARRGKTLLVLDNIERVALQIGEVVGTWLERCVDLQMLATTIVPMGIVGEINFELGPLKAADAIQLYEERAHRAWSGREASAADRAAIEELVGKLDRIPLAIELAAARIKVLPPQILLARFSEHLELLRSDSPGRHGSLLEALSLTWSLLPPDEQELLSKLSVFQGGFTAAAAVALFDEAMDEREMLDHIDGLRRKALLYIEEGDSSRFTLVESIREYANRKLIEFEAAGKTQLRHANYFVDRGEREVERLELKDFPQALGWLQGERENLTTILYTYAERDPPLAARAGHVLFSLLSVEGTPTSTLQIMETTLAAARRIEEPLPISRALGRYAMALAQQSRNAEAIKIVFEALEIVQQSGHREEEGLHFVRLASIYITLGDVDQASTFLEDALRISRSVGAPLLEAKALTHLAGVALARQDTDKAEELYHRTAALVTEHGYYRIEVLLTNLMAIVKFNQGSFREARRMFQTLLAHARAIGNRMGEAIALLNLGSLELAAGVLDQAAGWSLEARAHFQEISERRGEGAALSTLGVIALEKNELALAEERLAESVGILEEYGDRINRALILPFVAVIEARAGRLFEARRSMDDARTFFMEAGDTASLELVELLEGALELAEARGLDRVQSEEVGALVESARARLDTAKKIKVYRCGTMYQAVRILEKDLDHWAAGSREASAPAPSKSLRIGPNATWFELPGGGRVDLRRRMALRRMLDHLTERRLNAPGEGSLARDLFEVGWPGINIDQEAAIRRVYLGIWNLRDLGLSGMLLNQTDGYLLDPAVPLLRGRE